MFSSEGFINWTSFRYAGNIIDKILSGLLLVEKNARLSCALQAQGSHEFVIFYLKWGLQSDFKMRDSRGTITSDKKIIHTYKSTVISFAIWVPLKLSSTENTHFDPIRVTLEGHGTIFYSWLPAQASNSSCMTFWRQSWLMSYIACIFERGMETMSNDVKR